MSARRIGISGLNTLAEFAKAFLARVPKPGRVLLPGPARRLEEPRSLLAAAGFEVRELPLYQTTPLPAEDLPDVDFTPGDIVFFCSPSTVRAFTGSWTERPRCVTIGETTAQAARAAGFEAAVAATPDLSSMVLAAGLGYSGLGLTAIGCLGLFFRRALNADLRRYSVPLEFINLLAILSVVVVALVVHLSTDP